MQKEFWRPVRESNPCRRREREENHCNSRKLGGLDSTLPHFEDLRVRYWNVNGLAVSGAVDFLRLLVVSQVHGVSPSLRVSSYR